jgi:hypothetical protein
MRGGFLAAATVAVFYFVADLLQLAPLATPAALGHALMGPWAVELDFPIVAQAANGALYGAKLFSLTAIHFLAFGVVTAVVVALCDRIALPVNVVSGAVLGLVGYTAAFGIGLALLSIPSAAGVPGVGSAALANLMGGGIMGFYMQMGE